MCIYVHKTITINLHFVKTLAGKRKSGISGHFGIELRKDHSDKKGRSLMIPLLSSFPLFKFLHCWPITTSSAPETLLSTR